MSYILDDTIVAIATAPGAGGLAVVRASGAQAIALADRVFRGARPLAEAPGNTLHHGWIVAPGDEPAGRNGAGHGDGANGGGGTDGDRATRLDEIVAAVFRAPHSYTREDVVEFSCHGGRLSATRVLEALLAVGARLAGPGEFTLRAFLNGRIDLVQAEAVADVIRAETRAAHDLALGQLAGALSARLGSLADRIADALAEVEARVDFAEDVGGIEVPEHVIAAIGAVGHDLSAMLAGASYARAVREGARVPLVGRPNAGKSSLFNALVGEARAIVTEVPGTTRDRVSEAVEIAGVRVTLSDTAGLRETPEPVEAIGVHRAREALRDSALVVWVVDGAAPLDDTDRALARDLAGKRVLAAINKRDLPAAVGPAEVEALLAGAAERASVEVSALDGSGLDALRESLRGFLGDDVGAAVSNPRHVEALERAREALDRAAACGRAGEPGEIVAIELRACVTAIGEVTGRDVAEDLLDRIFGAFCIGK